MIIARTDARAMFGMDEAIARANEALVAGAAVAFVEGAQSAEELTEIPRLVRGSCVFNSGRRQNAGGDPERRRGDGVAAWTWASCC